MLRHVVYFLPDDPPEIVAIATNVTRSAVKPSQLVGASIGMAHRLEQICKGHNHDANGHRDQARIEHQ